MKPEPPSDMWSSLDAAVQKYVKFTDFNRPPNSFTRAEFQKRYNVTTESSARRHLAKLMRADKVRKVGYVGAAVYYVMSEDDK